MRFDACVCVSVQVFVCEIQNGKSQYKTMFTEPLQEAPDEEYPECTS